MYGVYRCWITATWRIQVVVVVLKGTEAIQVTVVAVVANNAVPTLLTFQEIDMHIPPIDCIQV
jgi:hypothetical protein